MQTLKPTSSKQRMYTNKQMVLFAIVLIAVVATPLTYAANPFQSGVTGLSADTKATLTPVAGIAVMISGVLAATGRIPWMIFIGVIVAIVFIFGSDQIVSWIRSLFGV